MPHPPDAFSSFRSWKGAGDAGRHVVLDSTSNSFASADRSLFCWLMATRLLNNDIAPNVWIKFGDDSRAERVHAHMQWSLAYVRQGRTRVTIGGTTHELEQSTYLSVPPGIPHLCVPDGSEPFRFAVIYVGPPTNHRAGGLAEPRIGRIDPNLFGAACNRMLDAADHESFTEALLEILACIDDGHAIPIPGTVPVAFDDPFLVEHKSVSRYTHYRETRHRHGLSPKGIELNTRVERALQSLRSGSSVAAVAADYGFVDQSHFTRTLKRYTGLTPARSR